MRKIIVSILIISAAGYFSAPANAYTLSGNITGGVFLGGITYIYVVSTDFSGDSLDFYIGLTPLGNGVYTVLNVEAGDYILFAFQDRDYNLIPSVDDYFGFYGDTLPEVVAVSGNMSGLDIQIAELPYTTISGTLSYNGSNMGLTMVQAFRDDGFTDLAFFSILLDSTGSGDYTMFADSGLYYVRAFIDVDNSFSLSEGDPVGYYGQPGQPELVDVTGGSAQGIDFEIFDTQKVSGITPPQDFRVYPVYPNPFNGSVEIAFRLDKTELVEIKLYNIVGGLVNSFGGMYPAGDNRFTIDLSVQSSGVYLIRLDAGGRSITEKVILQK